MGDADNDEPKLLCYNRGCGKEYKESENTFSSCNFHPGTPYFHDAYKGWTCCRKSVDFTEFLNMKGCAKGHHSNVKPPEPEKKDKKEERIEEVVTVSQPMYVPKQRPSADEPLVPLQATMSESLKKQTYEKNQRGEITADGEIKIGITQCVNKGCTSRYEGPESNAESCKHHPGVPIFHEGLKFWSCCQKRTTDFDVFMKQPGCSVGSHLWIKPKENSEGGTKFVKCRHDWHQDGSFVHVVIYGGGKKYDPSKSHMKVNSVKLDIELFFPEEQGSYKQNWLLAGIIVPGQSSVFMTPMKIEIKLKKAEPVHWSNLNISNEALKSSVENNIEEQNHKSVGVDPLDLSDL